ncbi:MAG: hypothetical protein WCA08_17865 [Desulfoferrobacter sp.]
MHQTDRISWQPCPWWASWQRHKALGYDATTARAGLGDTRGFKSKLKLVACKIKFVGGKDGHKSDFAGYRLARI